MPRIHSVKVDGTRHRLRETEAITDAGLVELANLPHLCRFTISGAPGVSRQGLEAFPARVRVDWS